MKLPRHEKNLFRNRSIRLVAESQTTNEAQITLHSLQSSAETTRALYDSFLQRYMESVQQQSFPVSDARLITRATRPLTKSSPKPMLVLALAGFGGVILGLGLGVLRDISDRVFRSTSQVEERIKADCISVVPLVTSAPKPKEEQWPEDAGGLAGRRIIVDDNSRLWIVANSPLSRFAEIDSRYKSCGRFEQGS